MSGERTSPLLKVGIAGLGRAGGGILSSLRSLPDLEIVAAADPRPNARELFVRQIGGRTYDDVQGLCQDDEVQALWIATPTHLHSIHAQLGALHGKHIVVEKPFAVTVSECEQIITAAEQSGVALIAGGSRSFDPAFVAMRGIVDSGRLGRLCALNTWSFTDWILRPREPYELDIGLGGGAVFNQAPHPVDVLRLLGGGLVHSVRGVCLSWMAERPGPGYFTGLLEFEDGTPATMSYNGYGYIEGWEFLPWGETTERQHVSSASYNYRRGLRSGNVDEYAARERRRYGGANDDREARDSSVALQRTWAPADAGLVVASFEYGEVRQSSHGLYVYDDEGRHDEQLPDANGSRMNEVTELRRAIDRAGCVIHDGYWGLATMEVVTALIESGRDHKEVHLQHQVAVPRSSVNELEP